MIAHDELAARTSTGQCDWTPLRLPTKGTAEVETFSGGERRASLLAAASSAPDLLLLERRRHHSTPSRRLASKRSSLIQRCNVVDPSPRRVVLDNRGGCIPGSWSHSTAARALRSRANTVWLEQKKAEAGSPRRSGEDRVGARGARSPASEWCADEPRARHAKSKARIGASRKAAPPTPRSVKARQVEINHARPAPSVTTSSDAEHVRRVRRPRLLVEGPDAFLAPPARIVGVIGRTAQATIDVDG